MTIARPSLLNAAFLTQPPPGIHHGSLTAGGQFLCLACERLLDAAEWAKPCQPAGRPGGDKEAT